MNKIKNLISKISEDVKKLVKQFPITMVLIVFVTLLFAVTVDMNFSKEKREIINKIYMFSIVWGVGTFFSETFSNKRNKIICYVITGIISAVMTQLMLSNTAENENIIFYSKMLAVYLIDIFLISMYRIIKDSKLSFDNYLLNVFRSFVNISVTYGILNIGIVILDVIFVELILDGSYGMSLTRMLILLCGLFYVPAMLYTISGINKKEVNSFIKGLVLYVMLPLVVCAMTIIYIYIFKIIILRDIPKNIIYRILAGLFVVAFPVWSMANNYKEEKNWVAKVCKYMPYLFIPFIALEIYSINVRILKYGVTPLRYFANVFIIVQVIILFLTFYKNKEKILKIFPILAIITFFSIFTPLNFENISNLSQKNIILKNMPEGTSFGSLTDAEKEKVKSAYNYLKFSSENKENVPSYITENMASEIENYYNKNNDYDNRYDYDNSAYYYNSVEFKTLDVSKYSKMTEISDFIDSGDIYINKEYNFKIDFSDFASRIVKEKTKSSVKANYFFEENNLMKIDDNKDIYLTYMSFSYDTETNKIKDLNFNGYLLEK